MRWRRRRGVSPPPRLVFMGRAHQDLNHHQCVFAGTLACVSVWGHMVVFVKTNSIPAVFNIPASHTLFPTASGIKLPLGSSGEAPQSPTVLLARAV